ncbi:MAG: DUF5305 family protein [Candidatus Methanofastidiosia archaeon]
MNNKKVAIIGIVFIVFIASCVWFYTEYNKPIVEDTKVLRYSYTLSGQHDLSAKVLMENPICERGTTLSGMAGYFYSVSPVADIVFSFGFEPTIDNASITVVSTSTLILKSVDDDGVAFWSKEIPISSSTLEANGMAALEDSFSVDAASIKNQIEEIKERLGSSAGQEACEIVTKVIYNGTVSTTTFGDEKTYRFSIYFGPEYFSTDVVGTPQTDTTDFYEICSIEKRKGIWNLILPVGAVFASIAALLSLIYTYGETSAGIEIDKYKEWISNGKYPGGKWDKKIMLVNIRDLVDVAIDSRKRVIHDREKAIFFVVDGDILYYYMKCEEES